MGRPKKQAEENVSIENKEYETKVISDTDNKVFIDVNSFAEIVDNVVNECFKNNEYNPINKEFEFKKNILKYYAKYDVDEDEVTTYKLCFSDSIWAKLLDSINIVQYNALINAIENIIKHKLEMVYRTVQTASDAMIENFGEIATMIKDMIKGFKGFDPNMISEMLPKLANSVEGISQKGLVKQVVKENLAQKPKKNKSKVDNIVEFINKNDGEKSK